MTLLDLDGHASHRNGPVLMAHMDMHLPDFVEFAQVMLPSFGRDQWSVGDVLQRLLAGSSKPLRNWCGDHSCGDPSQERAAVECHTEKIARW